MFGGLIPHHIMMVSGSNFIPRPEFLGRVIHGIPPLPWGLRETLLRGLRTANGSIIFRLVFRLEVFFRGFLRGLQAAGFPVINALHFFTACWNALVAPFRETIFVLRIAVRRHFLYFAFETFAIFLLRFTIYFTFENELPSSALVFQTTLVTVLLATVFAVSLTGNLAAGFGTRHEFCLTFLGDTCERLPCGCGGLELGHLHSSDDTLFISTNCNAGYAPGGFLSSLSANHNISPWWISPNNVLITKVYKTSSKLFLIY